MKLEIWKIRGQKFHFGRQGLGQEISATSLSSDSLFAAAAATAAALWGTQAVTEFCQPFLDGDPPFALTSTYAFAGAVLFFPAPLRLPPSHADSAVRMKDLKRVDLLSESVFRRVSTGEPLETLYQENCLRQGNRALVADEELSKLPAELALAGSAVWHAGKRPRVAVDRRSDASQIYHTGAVHFQRDCGLWFGVCWRSETEELRRRLETIFQELGVAGLGAERSSGYGLCDISRGGEVDLPDSGSGPWINLGSYLPRNSEMEALTSPFASYKLKRISGWIGASGQRRRAVTLLREGSVLGPLPGKLPGAMVDVRPSYAMDVDPLGHPVYRSGITVPVGWGGA